MFKVTCLIALKRKDQSPRILHLEILRLALESLRTSAPE
jgi:hypothetical protein